MLGWGLSSTVNSYADQKEPKNEEDFNHLSEDCLKKLIKWRNDTDGWLRVDLNNSEVKMYERPLDGYQIPMFKLESTLPTSAEEALQFTEEAPIEIRQKWDKLLEHLEVVEKINENIDVIYARYKGFFPIAKRDAVAFRCIRKFEDGTFVVFGHSILYNKNPLNNQYVRAKGISGTFYVPIEGEPYKCQIIRLALVDPMGTIPKWAIALGKRKVAEGISAMVKILLEKFGPNRIPLPLKPTEDETESSSEEFFESQEFYENFDKFDEDLPTLFDYSQNSDIKTTNSEKPKASNKLLLRKEGKLSLNKNWADILKQLQDTLGLLQNRLVIIENMAKPKKGGVFLSWISVFLLIVWPPLVLLVYHFFYGRRKARITV